VRLKRISAKSDPAVWLATGPLFWSSITLPTKLLLVEGLERVALARTRLAQKGQVKSMPPIEIACELWITKNWEGASVIDASAGLLSYQGHSLMGVRLPASTALIENQALLEAVLAHEFLHCFHILRKIITAHKHGVHQIDDLEHDPHSREQDDKRLASVRDWFHAEIDILHHDDPRLREVKKYVLTLAKELPVRTPRALYSLSSIDIPDDVTEHVARLLSPPTWPPTQPGN
jgi:hypothetical protein